MTTATAQSVKKTRTLEGTVVSDKMTKTVVVEVKRLKKNQKYQKQFKVTDRYQAHDEKGEYHTGDRVVIGASRPLSRHKRWVVIRKLESANE
jgi:small subunit ribosomal protein S17